jgi:predicted  nucleic acid-binding Zn-ribbon protein
MINKERDEKRGLQGQIGTLKEEVEAKERQIKQQEQNISDLQDKISETIASLGNQL